ncbi:helix-turn-helix domain-containing protein [Pseudomonas sp. LS1212]|uniref:response regulator transcription factor n=1 Tax=Pseudomonas sp. LS1212 TaxID=2972478 RepID=UPI00215B837C|nr:helix-turn-helix domain-containing protein [Pseudomonas sp. LS1212]UVJ43137.1 helix-turn-helix domain-containing protein [Pseudomonas sp. LS1212]
MSQPIRDDGHLTTVRLTLREQEVLRWYAQGKTSWEIGRILGCTEATVNFHFGNIRQKFSVSTRSAALLKAFEQGVLPHA